MIFKIRVKVNSGSPALPDEYLCGEFDGETKEDAIFKAKDFYAYACDTDMCYVEILSITMAS